MSASIDFYLHIPYRGWTDNSLKKNRQHKGLCSLQVKVEFLHIREKMPINRKGVTAFAVFILSIFVETRRKPVFGVGCRSPPVNLDFQ